MQQNYNFKNLVFISLLLREEVIMKKNKCSFKNKATWLIYYTFNYIRRKFNSLMQVLGFKIRIPIKFGKNLLTPNEANKIISDLILKGKPAMVARFGGNEALCTAEWIGIQKGIKNHFSKNILDRMHLNAGLFPYGKDMAKRFAQLSCESAKEVDFLGAWNSPMQDYLVKYECRPEIQITNLGGLEPYLSDNPWSAALKGKKVLVIHPFKETIEEQYKKRELLFENPDVLPEFELHVMKAVQTIAGEKDERFKNWEEALDYMHKTALEYDFDVAIIGCGAYGMPLAAKLKQSGKIAIHLGGATQLLFGIKGARWDNDKRGKLYNEHWVRPSESEKPKSAKKIENACYW